MKATTSPLDIIPTHVLKDVLGTVGLTIQTIVKNG